MLGPFPPPVHGMANVNLAVRELLTRHDGAPPTVLNIASASIRRTPAGLLLKLWRIVAALVFFTALLSGRRVRSFYLSASGGPGQLLELPFLCLARLARKRVYLHHHSFAYLNVRSTLTALYCSLAGSRAVHFVLCERMASLLRSRYGPRLRTVVISNSAFLGNPEGARSRPRSAVATVGYLSNVSSEKGIEDFIRVASELEAQDAELRFVIAGPCVDLRTRERVLRATRDLDNLEYRGGVYGAAKDEFLRAADVVLFPTQYKNEAEPLTILEALAHATVVIARDRGCIAELLRGGSGVVVPVGEDFVARAAKQLLDWIAAPEEYQRASGRSRRGFEELRGANEVNLKTFLGLLANP